jgi:hypothetical protein
MKQAQRDAIIFVMVALISLIVLVGSLLPKKLYHSERTPNDTAIVSTVAVAVRPDSGAVCVKPYNTDRDTDEVATDIATPPPVVPSISDGEVQEAGVWEVRAMLNDARASLQQLTYFDNIGGIYRVKAILKSEGHLVAGFVKFKYRGGPPLKDDSWVILDRNLEWLE